ncbi:MAG: hypothetical protein AAGD05_04500 [Bacteroidota bacterium]
MKKLIQLLALSACFLLLGASTVMAQDKVKNVTNCDFLVRVAYGPAGSCTSTGFVDAIVPAGTSIVVGIPAGTEIIAAKGYYTVNPPFCSFYVALTCAGGPLTDSVVCSSACNDYKARLYPGTGLLLYD